MKSVELYGRVRRSVLIDGMSRREAARSFGIDRRTVDKMLSFSIPPVIAAVSQLSVPSSMNSQV